MFFSLERNSNNRFPCAFTLGNLTLNTDTGWHRIQQGDHVFIYKGYMDTGDIAKAISSGSFGNCGGNYSIFEYRQNTIRLHTNLGRGYMIWYSANCVSNIFKTEYSIWNDQSLEVDQSLVVTHAPHDIVGNINTSTLSLNQAVAQIDTILSERISTALENFEGPIKVFLSGGIDSMLVYSYIKQFTNNYELVFENTIQWDDFWCNNHRTIQDQFWGYRQIHHWTNPCVLSSGTPGDEFMLRSPTTSNLFLLYHGSSILDLLEEDEWANSHHKQYFTKHRQLFIDQAHSWTMPNSNTEEFFWYLCNIVANDCQHWHLGETLTFTPLRDIEIFKTLLRLDVNDAKKQIMNSEVSRQLIAFNDPELLNYLSDDKNSGESFSNLVSLMHKHSTKSGQ